MSNCVVSVIMITYNHSNFIEKAVNSVLSQKTDFKFELIIANDKSLDNTGEIIENILNTNPDAAKIKYLDNNKNLGANGNYVNAYKNANSKYIAVCEGDDFWGDDCKLQKQVDFLENNPEYVLTYHDAQCINESGNLINNVPNCTPKKEFTSEDLIMGNQPLPLTTCYRKVMDELPSDMVTIINGDTFLVSLLGNFGKGKWLNIKPAFYRHHEGGVWSLMEKEYKLKSKIELFSVLKKYYKSKHIKDLSDYFGKELFLHHKMLLNFYVKQKKYRSFLNYILKNYKSLI